MESDFPFGFADLLLGSLRLRQRRLTGVRWPNRPKEMLGAQSLEEDTNLCLRRGFYLDLHGSVGFC